MNRLEQNDDEQGILPTEALPTASAEVTEWMVTTLSYLNELGTPEEREAFGVWLEQQIALEKLFVPDIEEHYGEMKELYQKKTNSASILKDEAAIANIIKKQTQKEGRLGYQRQIFHISKDVPTSPTVVCVYPHADDLEGLARPMIDVMREKYGPDVNIKLVLLTDSAGGSVVKLGKKMPHEEMRQVRTGEAITSGKSIGLRSIVMLNMPDGGLKHLSAKTLQTVLEAEVNHLNPSAVVAFSPKQLQPGPNVNHADHTAYLDVLHGITQANEIPYYGTNAAQSEVSATRINMTLEHYKQAAEAMAPHRSQFDRVKRNGTFVDLPNTPVLNSLLYVVEKHKMYEKMPMNEDRYAVV